MSKVSVAPTYSTPDSTPPHATAPGRIRLSSSVSAPLTAAGPSPTKPKQITPKEFSTKRGWGGIRKSAAEMFEPKRDQITAPRQISTPAATKVPAAPMLLIHLPTPSPRMLNTVSNPSSARDAAQANTLLSASPKWFGPSA